jgi:hypothetical protein
MDSPSLLRCFWGSFVLLLACSSSDDAGDVGGRNLAGASAAGASDAGASGRGGTGGTDAVANGGAGAAGTGTLATGGAAASGNGGAGAAGAPVVEEEPPVPGFAGVESSGLLTTTGGADASPTTVTTCAELANLLADDQPRVLEIPAGTTLDCRTTPLTQPACELQCSSEAAEPVFWRVPVGDQTCTTLADFDGDGTLDVPAGKLVDKVRRELSLAVGSN